MPPIHAIVYPALTLFGQNWLNEKTKIEIKKLLDLQISAIRSVPPSLIMPLPVNRESTIVFAKYINNHKELQAFVMSKQRKDGNNLLQMILCNNKLTKGRK